MKKELIKDHMVSPAISIADDVSLAEAHKIMSEKGIRRLPVLDGNILVGIVALGDILEAEPSDASTLSVWEVNYLLAKLKVKDIMTKDPLTLSPNDTIVDAAKIMLDKKYGGIPIVEDRKLVGIMTQSDIFRMIVREWS